MNPVFNESELLLIVVFVVFVNAAILSATQRIVVSNDAKFHILKKDTFFQLNEAFITL